MARLKWLIIPVFVVFLMSHNAGAVSQTYYLKNGIYAYGIPAITGNQGGSTVDPSSGEQFNLLNNIYILPANRIWYSSKFYFNSEHTRLDLSEYTDYTFTFSYCSSSSQHFVPTSNDYFRLTDYYEFEADIQTTLKGNIDNDFNITLDQYTVDKCRNVLLKGKVQTSNESGFQLGTTNNGSFSRIFGFDYTYNVGSTIPLYIISPTVVFYTDVNEADEALEKERQETQEQSDAGDSAADSSTDAVEGATQNLFSAMGSIVSAVKDTPATNCLIDITTTGNSSAFTSAIGSINLCADVPSNILNTVRGLAALVIVPAVLYACYSICIKMYRTFTEVQNT